MDEEIGGSVNASYQRERRTIWQRLGFGQCRAPDMSDEHFSDFAASRLFTTAVIVLDWGGLLRLVVSRKLYIAMAHRTDVPIGQCVSQTNVSVLPPGCDVSGLGPMREV